MADNNFFRNFLKKDKLFHATQNNPVHKKALHQLPYTKKATIRFLNNAGQPIPVGNYNEIVRFHPAPAHGVDNGTQRVRLPSSYRYHSFSTTRKLPKTIYNAPDLRDYIRDNFSDKPARAVGQMLPNVNPIAVGRNRPVVGRNGKRYKHRRSGRHGYIPRSDRAERIKENQQALASIGRYEIVNIEQTKPNEFETNYWYPDYQGNYHFATRNSINVPITFPEHLHKPSNLPKFIPKGFLSEKQKESAIWLDSWR